MATEDIFSIPNIQAPTGAPPQFAQTVSPGGPSQSLFGNIGATIQNIATTKDVQRQAGAKAQRAKDFLARASQKLHADDAYGIKEFTRGAANANVLDDKTVQAYSAIVRDVEQKKKSAGFGALQQGAFGSVFGEEQGAPQPQTQPQAAPLGSESLGALQSQQAAQPLPAGGDVSVNLTPQAPGALGGIPDAGGIQPTAQPTAAGGATEDPTFAFINEHTPEAMLEIQGLLEMLDSGSIDTKEYQTELKLLNKNARAVRTENLRSSALAESEKRKFASAQKVAGIRGAARGAGDDELVRDVDFNSFIGKVSSITSDLDR